MMSFDILVALLAAGFLVAAAVTGFSTMAAIVQMGSIQERSMPWAVLSKPIKTVVEKTTTTIATAAEKTTTAVSSTLATAAAKTTGSAEAVRTKDKVIYTASVINVCLTAYIFGAFPDYFYLWHTPKAIIYIAHRWITFKREGQHYLLYDFCYWANALSLLYAWVLPDNALLFQILFIVSNGPLAWSVLAFSQSLIFHSAPHMTSVFIHTSPMLLTFALRWNRKVVSVSATGEVTTTPSQFAICDPSYDPLCDGPDTTRTSLVYNAMCKFYLWWVVLYYLWVFVFLSNRIKQRGYKTLYDRVASKGPTKFLQTISTNEFVQKAAYMLVHVAFGAATMLLATSYWTSQVAHWIFLMGILTTSAWNASGFYFTVFAQKYDQDLKGRFTDAK